MQGYFIISMVVLYFLSETMGVLVNSPCKKTSDWNNYHIQCSTNHTIYIIKHVMEDGFNRLMFPALGCSVSDAVYCGVELPTNNNINHKNNYILESTVNTCNGRNECTLTRQYFLEAEAALKKYCNASIRPELQKATFRHSIDYDCVQDSQILDMCLTEDKSRYSNQPLYLKALDAECTCSLTGFVSRVEILQTMSVKILIQSNNWKLFEHQNTSESLYGVDIPVQADNLIIEIEEGSNTSLSLIKVISKGSFTIRCNKNINVRVSSSTVDTLRRAFRIETIGTTSFTQSKTDSSDVAITHGGVLSWIQTILIIFLLVLAFLIYYKKRTTGHNSVEIRIKDKQEKFMFVCYPKDEKKTSIEIHQAECICASNNEHKETTSPYTPLQIVNEVEKNNQTSSNSEYIDVI